MAYEAILAKFRPLHEMSSAELAEYAAWFHSIMPSRIAEVTRAITQTAGFERWKPDLTPASLDLLGRWLEHAVETRKLTKEEKIREESGLALPIDVPNSDLSDRMYSVAFDVGAYFAQVVIRNVPGTRWEQSTKGSRSFVDFGHPLIVGATGVGLNPVRVAINAAYRIAEGDQVSLSDLYQTWAGLLRGNAVGNA